MEVVVRLGPRLLLQAGIGSFVEAFALGEQFDRLRDLAQQPSPADRLTITSPAHLEQILIHLREQWHVLVKTDNLLGPRFALAGVPNQISVVEALRSVLRNEQRLEVVRLGAQYAESAAWLYEDAGNMAQARYWTSRAMEWAYEGDDERMLAWTVFQHSQQAATTPDAAQAIGLAQAARRNEEQLRHVIAVVVADVRFQRGVPLCRGLEDDVPLLSRLDFAPHQCVLLIRPTTWAHAATRASTALCAKAPAAY